MPDISQYGDAAVYYLPNDMLDVPAGVMVTNAAVAGTEVNASNLLTRLLIDWPAIGRVPVTSVRVQCIGRSNHATSPVAVRIRDMSNAVDVCSVDIVGTATGLFAGTWEPFTPPDGTVTYAVFVYGDGALDPTIFAATWEWRG